MNTKNLLREDSINFAIIISDICEKINGCSVYKNQLIRSSSSIGANLHEAKYAQSRADFINKWKLHLKNHQKLNIGWNYFSEKTVLLKNNLKKQNQWSALYEDDSYLQ